MVKVVNKGLRKRDDPIYQQGWTITCFPQFQPGPDLTTEQLAEKVLQDVQKMSPQEKAKTRRHLDKAFGPERKK